MDRKIKPNPIKMLRRRMVAAGTTLYRALRKKGATEFVSAAAMRLFEKLMFCQTKRIQKDSPIYLDRSELGAYGDRVVAVPWSGPTTLPYKGEIDRDESPEDVDTYDTPELRFVYEVSNATVFDPAGTAITRDGRILLETIGPPSLLQNGLRRELALAKSLVKNPSCGRLHRLTRQKTAPDREQNDIRQIEVACPLQPQYVNYYHWTVESLLRLDLLDRYTSKTGTKPTLLIPENPPSWLTDTLEHLGLLEQAVQCDRPTSVKTLVIPSYPEPAPSACRWIRDRVLEAKTNSVNRPKRVYVRRRKTTERRINNEAELLPILSEYGFEPFELETMSYAEQVELFDNAEVVFGPHGAGLCNVVYATETTLLELFGDNRKTTFSRLCQLLGLGYDAIQGSQTGPDVSVDPDHLRQVFHSHGIEPTYLR